MNSLTHLKYDCDIFVVTMVTILEQKHSIWKQRSYFTLKCYYSRKKYLTKLKQHGLRDALSKEFSFKCLSVMIYEQFIVSIVELIMLSWQPILLYNFHNMTVIWLFCHFFKLQVYILNGLENISIFNIWKLWLVRCDVIFGETSLILPKISENFWSKVIPLWWFPGLTLKLNNSRTAWPIPAIYISFSSILNALSYEINLFSRCSSPLRPKFPASLIWTCRHFTRSG